MPEINPEVVKEALSGRYHECNTDGHKNPNYQDGVCDHCYRHLEYKTPMADGILKGRKDIPLHRQPFDAAWINRQRKDERADLRERDWLNGMKRLMEEMEGQYRISE